MGISTLKDEVKRLEGKLKSYDQGIEALMVKRADLIDQVMSWEAEAITVRDSLKEAELSRSEDIANAVDKALAKFKSSKDFFALLKKDHDTGFDTKVDDIFYNILMHYRDLQYAFSGGEMTDLIREWIEDERLNALDVVPPSVPSDPWTSNVAEIEISPVDTSEQLSRVEVGEMTAAPVPQLLLRSLLPSHVRVSQPFSR